MECLHSTPITGKAFMIRLLTAPVRANRQFCCLAEELSSDKIMFEMGREFPGRSIIDLLNSWAKSHGYKIICWEEWKNGIRDIIEWRVR